MKTRLCEAKGSSASLRHLSNLYGPSLNTASIQYPVHAYSVWPGAFVGVDDGRNQFGA
jgi:hypothetical protein